MFIKIGKFDHLKAYTVQTTVSKNSDPDLRVMS